MFSNRCWFSMCFFFGGGKTPKTKRPKVNRKTQKKKRVFACIISRIGKARHWSPPLKFSYTYQTTPPSFTSPTTPINTHSFTSIAPPVITLMTPSQELPLWTPSGGWSLTSLIDWVKLTLYFLTCSRFGPPGTPRPGQEGPRITAWQRADGHGIVCLFLSLTFFFFLSFV